MSKKRKRILIITLAVLGVIALIVGVYFLVRAIRISAIETGLDRIDVCVNGVEIESNEEYVQCTVSLTSGEDVYSFENLEAGIRLRGNDTRLYYPKKPYRIKFEKKTSVYGEPENKSWVLLALYNDYSLIKDYLAFTVADKVMAGDFVPSHNFVDLYLDGEYQGVYLLTDQVNEKSGRLDVEYNFAAEDKSVPFLVELDNRAPEEGEEGVDWFAIGTKYYAVKYPNATERYTKEQFEYIEGYVKKVDSLMKKKDVTIAELEEYIDVDSFVNFYIVQEAMGQMEINWKSVYMSKTKDGKLKMGPVWDFDWSTTGPSIGVKSDKYWDITEGFKDEGHWFYHAYKNSMEVRKKFATRYAEVREDILQAITDVESIQQTLAPAAEKNHLLWYWYSPATFYEEHFERVIWWCRERIAWLDTQFVAK